MSGSTRSSWLAIREELMRRIAVREWAPGSAIPGEQALAVEFGASRSTVNRAMQDLAAKGLVERKRKAGSHVVEHPVREARFVIPLVRQEIEASSAAYDYRLLSRDFAPAPAAITTRLKLSAGTTLLRLRCLHLADGKPYQYEDRWINSGSVPAALEADFQRIGPNEWLVSNAPFSDAEFSFFAAAANEAEAAALGLEDGSPVFVGERLTWLLDAPITLVQMVHPPSHRVVSRI